MSEEREVVPLESKATPEQQAAAEKMGWIPPTRYKGEPERFVDADLYIERGETVLPIVKEQNKRLQGELARVSAEQERTAAALRQAQKAIEEIEERHTVATQKAVEQARKELKQQLAAASEAEDHEAVAEITAQMIDLNAAEKEAAPLKKNGEEKPAFSPPPELRAWNDENPWFGTDKRKTALALAIADELGTKYKAEGKVIPLADFYREVGEETERVFSPKEPAPRGDKVEGSRNGGSGDARTGGKKGYAALPAEAKKACDDDSRQFVGEGRKYKDLNAWRARYAEMYFEES